MKKKVIIVTGILVILTSVILVLTKDQSTNKEIEKQVAVDTSNYTTINKQLVLTNDSENFYINEQLIPEEIRVKPETALNVEVVNNSDYETSVHFHGVNGDNKMDGVGGLTQENIKPGESFTYKFDLDDEGTYMYHSHVDSLQQVNNENLYGGLVVEEAQKENSDMLIYNTLVNDEEQHHTANQSYDQVLVNGESNGQLKVNNDENIYLNIANLSSAPLSIYFGDGINYRVLSIDANDATSAWYSNESLAVSTGQRLIVELENPLHSFQVSTSLKSKQNARYDIVYKGDENINSKDFSGPVSGGMMDNQEMAELADDSIDLYDIIETNSFDLSDEKVDVKETMSLDMNAGMWVINNKAYPDTNSIDVTEGDIVEITLKNDSHMGEMHPFHLHGHKFQVVEVNGNEVDKNLVMDTVNVPPGNQVKIRFEANNPGIWAFHCHNLVHASKGMFTTVNYEGYENEISGGAQE